MELSSPPKAFINIAFNNESNKVEDFNIIRIDRPDEADYIQNFNLFAKKVIHKSRLDENDIPDIDIVCYFLSDTTNYTTWPEKPAVTYVENVILPYLYNKRYAPLCKKNTLDIEFKRLAAIGKDIKQTLNLDKAPQLLLKYKNESNITHKQITKLLEYFEKEDICPNELPYQVVDNIINALFQTQYYQKFQHYITSSLLKADYIDALSLFLTYFNYSYQDSHLMSDLYRLQNTTSLDECIGLVRKYKNSPHITRKQAEILVLKLKPENIFNLKQFQLLNPSLIFNELRATKYYQEFAGKNNLFSISHSLQIIELDAKIEDTRNIIHTTSDPDEKELQRGLFKKYIAERLSMELIDINSLSNDHISPITQKRLENILSFINSNLSYDIPESIKNKTLKLLSEKEYILQKRRHRTEHILGLSPISDLENNISYLINSVTEGKSRLIIPDQDSSYMSVPELKKLILSSLNIRSATNTNLLHTKFIFPNVVPDKEDFMVEKIIKDYLTNFRNLSLSALAFLSTQKNRIDLDILNNADQPKEQSNLILPKWVEKLAKNYHLLPSSGSSQMINDKLEKEAMMFGKNISKSFSHFGPHL